MPATDDSPLSGLSEKEIDILKTLKRSGALLEPEVPLKLGRVSDDLSAELRNLRLRRLVNVHTVEHYGEKMDIYQTTTSTDKLL